MLEIRHLRKEYGSSTPLKDINCSIAPGEVVSIIGPSGTGKSTLLRCINRLEQPTSGEILYNGQNILGPDVNLYDIRRHIGMVFQSFNVFPHLTVLQNVMQPQIDLGGRTKQEAYDRACELLKQVGLWKKAASFPGTLSGGQKQRIAIARTLAMDNDILLLDEPTSALDPAMVGEVESVIQGLTKTGITMLIVTHEMRFARAVSSRILYLDDGIVTESGTPEQIFEHPQNEKTRRFIFRIHELPIELHAEDFDLYSCMTDITRFAESNYLSRKVINSIISVFEEIVGIHLMPAMGPDDKADVVLDCSEMTDVVTMTISCTMDFDMERDVDEVSMAIIRHHIDNFRCTAAEAAGGRNQTVITIRKD